MTSASRENDRAPGGARLGGLRALWPDSTRTLTARGHAADWRLGERAFEIVLARQMAAGELETAWFERHGSTPITELPAHWPADYRTLSSGGSTLIEIESRYRADRAAGVQAALERRAVGAAGRTRVARVAARLAWRSPEYLVRLSTLTSVASWPTECAVMPSSCRWRSCIAAGPTST